MTTEQRTMSGEVCVCCGKPVPPKTGDGRVYEILLMRRRRGGKYLFLQRATEYGEHGPVEVEASGPLPAELVLLDGSPRPGWHEVHVHWGEGEALPFRIAKPLAAVLDGRVLTEQEFAAWLERGAQ